MTASRRLLASLVVLFCLAPALGQTPIPVPVPAQTPVPGQAPARTEPEQIRQDITQLENQLSRNTQGDSELVQMRARIDPIIAALNTILARETPRLEGINARLAEIGPKPDAKAPPESEEVAQNRAEQERLKRDADEAIRVTRLLLVRAEQAQVAIADRRRALFRQAILQQTQGIASPWLWLDVARTVPGTTDDLRAFFSFRIKRIIDRADTVRLVSAAALLLLLCAAVLPAWRAQRRFLTLPDIARPPRLQKALWALRRTIVPVATPLAAIFVMFGVFDLLDIGADRLGELVRAILLLIPAVAVLRGLANGVLSPHDPAWRLVPISDRNAGILYDLAHRVAWIFVVAKALEAINQAISAALPVTIVMRGMASVLTGILVLRALRRTELRPEAGKDGLTPATAGAPAPPLVRPLALATALAIGGSALGGYVALSSFLVDQSIWLLTLAGLMFILLTLVEETFGRGLPSASPVGRNLRAATGLSSGSMQQISILSSGLLKIVLFVATAMLALAPWGIDSGGVLDSLGAAFFGFQVGGIHVSISTLALSLALFLIAFFITRVIQRWLEGTYLPSTSLDIGLRNSIKTIFGYVGFLVAMVLSLGQLGVSLDKITLVAGALSVGIGFGLQSIVNNFVSGLILLWERPIRVGDWIVVGEEQGKVKRINVRATEIETFDRASLIVPNSEFISGRVKNWMHSDRLGRIILPIAISYAADPKRTREVLLEVAKAHSQVLTDPEPRVYFMKLGQAGIEFELRCFTDVDVMLQTRSDLLFAIHDRLTETDI